jgi:DNA-binding transcriptional LysR family regulator
VEPADLAGHRWVTREEGSGTLEVFLDALPEIVKPLDIIMEFDNLESIKRAVEYGEVLGCISRFAIKREVEQKALAIIPTPYLDLRREYSFLVHRERHQNQLLNYFMAHCFLAAEQLEHALG